MKKDKTVEESGSRSRLVSFKSGFTNTFTLSVLYAIVCFIPAYIYLNLMTGGFGTIPVAWFTLLLWVELGKLTGRKISKQEATLILIITGAEMVFPLTLVYNAWYVTSPIAKKFDIGRFVPEWAAPPEEAGVMDLRTFLNPAWVFPIGVTLATTFIFGLLYFGLALFGRELYIETERLPFPMQQMNAQALVTITGEERRPLHILAVFALIGFAWGFILYALPFVMQAYKGVYAQVIPIPWVDLNTRIEPILPGACFGIATDIMFISAGIILPFSVVIGIFIGSIAVWFFGGWLVQSNWEAWGLPDTNPELPGVQSWWFPGMNIHLTWERSLLYFWAAITVGIALSVGIAPILRRPRLFGRALARMLRPTSRPSERYTDPISFKKVTLPMLLVGMIGGLVLFVVLVPDFAKAYPWIFPLMVFAPFAMTIIGGRVYGEAGVNIANIFPYLRNVLYLGSGYAGVDVWFAPNLMTATGHGRLTWFKTAELTETRSDSMIKAYWFLLPIALLVGYLYVELFWRLAPIPSARYPGAAIFWDIQATMTSLWIRGRVAGLFNPLWILYSFIVGSVLFLGIDLIHIGLPFAALGAGIGVITPFAVTYLIGGVIAQIFRRKMGTEWWDKHKYLIGAGLTIGEGIAVTLAVGIALVINSIWILHY